LNNVTVIVNVDSVRIRCVYINVDVFDRLWIC